MRGVHRYFRYPKCAAALAATAFCLLACAPRKVPVAEWDKDRADRDRAILQMISDNDYSGVVRLTSKMIDEGISDARLLGQRALALGMTGREEEAISLFSEALLDDYSNCENHLNLAVILMRTGRTGRAMTEFREAGRFCGPENQAMIKRNLAVANIKLGREDEARQKVEEGLSIEPGDPYLLGMKGMLIAAESPALAERLFSAAMAGSGIDNTVIYQLGMLFLTTGRADEAVLPLKEYFRSDPDDAEAGMNYSESLIRTGRLKEAEEVLLDLWERHPRGQAGKKLADLYYRMDRFGEALPLYEAAGDDPKILDRVAMCLHRLGRTEEAIEIEEGVVAALPAWTTGAVNLSAMLAAVGRLDDAEQLLQKVLEMEPDNLTARYNIEKLRKALDPGSDGR